MCLPLESEAEMMSFMEFSSGMGLFLFLILFLSWQERKDRELHTKVYRHLNSQSLRGLIAVRPCRFFFLSRKVVLLEVQSPIYFDFGNCPNEEAWKAMKEILPDLPGNVRLKIRFIPDKRIRATIVMEHHGKG
jgi:hypothetical protein